VSVINVSVEENFQATFGKPFDRKALLKLVVKALKTKEDEYLINLISHFSVADLLKMKKELDAKKTRNPNS
jgi:hypothetical protein